MDIRLGHTIPTTVQYHSEWDSEGRLYHFCVYVHVGRSCDSLYHSRNIEIHCLHSRELL